MRLPLFCSLTPLRQAKLEEGKGPGPRPLTDLWQLEDLNPYSCQFWFNTPPIRPHTPMRWGPRLIPSIEIALHSLGCFLFISDPVERWNVWDWLLSSRCHGIALCGPYFALMNFQV